MAPAFGPTGSIPQTACIEAARLSIWKSDRFQRPSCLFDAKNMGKGNANGIIAVDAMGGDMGPVEVVNAVAMALKRLPDLEGITLLGREEELYPLLQDVGLSNEPRLQVFNASQVIGMEEKPVQSLKQKRDASLVRAIELVKEGKCSAVVSCGNTGSLMACGTLKLRLMPGIDRPALAIVVPNKDHHFVLIDAGANPGAKPEQLVHNAILGSHYAQIVLEKPRPCVGLLSIGTEETKGLNHTLDTHQKLKKLGPLVNYIGLIEGFDVFNNQVDVVVCDGHVGNILLKSWEGLVEMFKNFIQDEIKKNIIRRTGIFLTKGVIKSLQRKFNPDLLAGAPLLGLQGNVLKTHGSCNCQAFMSAIRIA